MVAADRGVLVPLFPSPYKFKAAKCREDPGQEDADPESSAPVESYSSADSVRAG